MASGLEFRIHWCYALWSFIGLFAVVFPVPNADELSLRRLSLAWAGVFLIAALVYAGANRMVSHDPSGIRSVWRAGTSFTG